MKFGRRIVTLLINKQYKHEDDRTEFMMKADPERKRHERLSAQNA